MSLQFKKTNQPNYGDYVASLRELLDPKSAGQFPRLVVVGGPSPYLGLKALDAVKNFWDKHDIGVVHSLETSELSEREFLTSVSQSSLFESNPLYILKRTTAVKNFSSWFGQIKDLSALRAHLILDAGDKISLELQKQLKRLGAVHVPCYEPVGIIEYRKFLIALSKRHQLDLTDHAIAAILDATGLDLCKIENEILKLSLQFAGVSSQLDKPDVLPALGVLREDDVFDLFRLMRDRKRAKAHLLSEGFLNRGESAIALTGIFARFSREQIERGSLRSGIAGLNACIDADRRLKASSLDETIVLSSIIEAVTEV